MKRDGYLIIDKHGHIRVPENITFTGAERIADVLFQCSGKDIGVKELDVGFAEYDEREGRVKPKGPGTRWTREHEQFYLENADLDNDTLAGRMNEKFGTNRSGMSIKMKYDSIVRPFDSWCDDHATKLEGVDRKERVKRYMEGD